MEPTEFGLPELGRSMSVLSATLSNDASRVNRSSSVGTSYGTAHGSTTTLPDQYSIINDAISTLAGQYWTPHSSTTTLPYQHSILNDSTSTLACQYSTPHDSTATLAGQYSILNDSTSTLSCQYGTPHGSTTTLAASTVGISSAHVFYGNVHGS